jgi:hypothetical protein
MLRSVGPPAGQPRALPAFKIAEWNLGPVDDLFQHLNAEAVGNFLANRTGSAVNEIAGITFLRKRKNPGRVPTVKRQGSYTA